MKFPKKLQAKLESLKPSPPKTEPLIGWRSWEYSKGTLYSVTRYIAWPKRKPLTVDDPNWHLAADNDPNGIHAYKLRTRLMSSPYAERLGRTIAGSVFLWGMVKEYTEGFRAEFAYPRSLIVPSTLDPIEIMELEYDYGVKAEFDDALFPPYPKQQYTGFTGNAVYTSISNSTLAINPLLLQNMAQFRQQDVKVYQSEFNGTMGHAGTGNGIIP
jgi:hypothetical protein